MEEYLRVVKEVLDKGSTQPNRTGVPAKTVLGYQFEHDMSKGFPILTTKYVPIKLVAVELEFFIKGLTDKRWLQERGCHIWDYWANPLRVKKRVESIQEELKVQPDFFEKWLRKKKENNQFIDEKRLDELLKNDYRTADGLTKIVQFFERDLGPIYGWVWRHAGAKYQGYDKNYSGEGFDQLKNVIDGLKSDPHSRRHMVSAWQPQYFEEMALPPCHDSFQLYVLDDKINLLWRQRSVDVMLGLPFNIASYGLLLELFSLETGYEAGKLIGQLGVVHIYENHVSGALEQLKREPKELPTLEIKNFDELLNFEAGQVELINYEYNPHIKFDVAV